MKYKYLAVVIPTLLAMASAHAAELYNKDGNKLNLYGQVSSRFFFADAKDDKGNDTYARIGFIGETQINEDLSGYGQWEYQANASNAEGSAQVSKTRVAFAGFKFSNIGSLDYGRNYGVVYDVEAYTDMMPIFGGDSYTYNDNFMNGRANNLLTYRNSDFFGLVEGLNFALQYQGKNEGSGLIVRENPATSDIEIVKQTGTNNRDKASANKDNGDGVGISVSYDSEFGVSLAAAYSGSDRSLYQSSEAGGAGGERAEAWTLGIKYDANSLYLAAMYAETRNMTPWGKDHKQTANKTQNFEVVAQYQFDFGLRPSIGYLYSRGTDLQTADDRVTDGDLVNYVDIGAEYNLNKNMVTYIDYKINLLEDNEFARSNSVPTDNILGLGLKYRF
ncbi:porin [Edwardsiella hoshinae]|uniref:Porin OmpN n=1 Tax=Edwardsiella hoshinae TaxID=93378 RepID=A0A376DLG0_9GAMM|nr:porin [Edwardsiella hoshinae]QPR29334.1 porin [Edwardsiella hoshinae]STC90739.1 Porin OmpN [Edwardsiella hoshinae]